MIRILTARFRLGQTVRHRENAFSGVVVDVDAAYAGQPFEVDPADAAQPFYRVLSTGAEGGFVAYAAEHVLVADAGEGRPGDAVDDGWLRRDRSGRLTPAHHRLQ